MDKHELARRAAKRASQKEGYDKTTAGGKRNGRVLPDAIVRQIVSA
jgi:hypothetical protein